MLFDDDWLFVLMLSRFMHLTHWWHWMHLIVEKPIGELGLLLMMMMMLLRRRTAATLVSWRWCIARNQWSKGYKVNIYVC